MYNITERSGADPGIYGKREQEGRERNTKRSPQRIFIMELREEPTEMTGKRFGRVLAIVLALTMLAGMVPAFAAGETAESVYVNGNIYTCLLYTSRCV